MKLTYGALDIQDAFRSVSANDSGCVNLFVGTVRSNTNGREVKQLVFESYEVMANREMKKIAQAVRRKWNVKNILIHHRLGSLKVGEIPIIIAISAARRSDAIEATRYTIDTFKATVPIWKKEVYGDGAEWVSPHP